MPFDAYPIGEAIDAFAAASPIARAQHDMLLQQLVAHARPTHLGALTRLACAIESEAIWQRIVTLVRKKPNAAKRIVTAAPWNTLARMVHDAILDRADRSTICAAISAARGQRDPAGADATRDMSIAFFAALNPDVWNALDPAVQRQWRYALDRPFVAIAVRSLGPRTEFLARAEMNNAIVHAARCHPCDTATLRATLLPVALRNCPLDQAYHLITAMPALLSDPGAFLAIASSNEEPSIIAAGRPMLRHPADLALAVVLQRSADEPTPRACAVLHDALRERTWEDLTPIMSLLDAKTRSAIMPDARTIADHLVRSRRRNDILQAIDRLMSIPPNAALPTLLMMTWWQPQRALEGAEALASTLRTHGDLFMALVDALPDVYRAAALPLPEDVALSHALRESARNDPLTAHHLAHALQRRNRHAVLHALLHLPATNAIDVWHAFGDETRQAIVDEIAEASPEAIKAVVSSPPDLFRAIWNALPPNVQRTLIVLPGFSDLASTLEPSRHPSPNPPLSTMKWRGRRR